MAEGKEDGEKEKKRNRGVFLCRVGVREERREQIKGRLEKGGSWSKILRQVGKDLGCVGVRG